jgi:tetratricopeptide (TPR) repeat protein
MLFALALAAGPVNHHAKAREMVAEVEKTSNPVRLFLLALDIRKELEAALIQKPDDAEVRLDLVRFFTVTPRIAGGDLDAARAHAGKLAQLDPPLGHFARGYIAYRTKDFGVARIELREAIRTAKSAPNRALAMRWLGWLSQESQQWDDAFAVFEELGDPYEIARTAAFCSCRLAEGRAALEAHLKAKPGHKEAKKLREKLARP